MRIYYLLREHPEAELPAEALEQRVPGVRPPELGPLELRRMGPAWLATLVVSQPDGDEVRASVDHEGRFRIG